jgi:hypothetical protein
MESALRPRHGGLPLVAIRDPEKECRAERGSIPAVYMDKMVYIDEEG